MVRAQVGRRACRVCLARRPRSLMVPLLAVDATASPAPALSPRDKIAFLTHSAVPAWAGAPRGVCTSCLASLDAAYSLASRCLAAEALLRETFQSLASGASREDVEDVEDLTDTIPLEVCVKLELSDHNDDSCREDISYDADIKKRDKSKKTTKKKKSTSKDLQCSYCGLVTKAPSALAIHLRTHTGERPHKCSVCGKAFAQKNTLKNHLNTHSSLRSPAVPTFTCEFCGKRFARKRDVVIHLRIHTGESPYACPFCPKRFKQVGPLIRHKRVHTGERPYQCAKCPKSFTDKYALTLHTTSHSDERRFSCTMCGKMVKTSNALRKHLDKHLYGKRHVCDKCGTAFTLKCNLETHMGRVHSERSGICSICEKPVPNLAEHLRRHTGQLYSCTLCNKKFLKEISLRAHSVRHRETNKYKCSTDGCLMAFPTQAMLQYHHIKAHTKEMPYSCEHCPKAYLRLCDLTKHLKVSHKILKQEEIRSDIAT